MKRRILFVDDELRVLEGLRRMLRNMRHEWEMQFASSGQEALDILGKTPHDVVVSDMRMPGMDGSQLLGQVRRLYPEVVRIILSGYSDKEMIMKSVLPAHQYLSKPCDADKLKAVVARACALRDLLTDGPLIRVISQIETLPSLPSLYLEVLEEVQSPTCSLEKVGGIISKDVGMTAKILQLTNSSFFGLAEHVSSPTRAVKLLGIETVKALAMSVHIFSQLSHVNLPGFSLDALWKHSINTAALSKAIAKEEKQNRRGIDDAFVAGLLHDVGKIILAANFPDSFRRIVAAASDSTRPFWECEMDELGTTHSQIGAYLMGLWGLPDQVVEAIAFHHSPGKSLCNAFCPLIAVHVANFIERERYPTGVNKINDALEMSHFYAIGMHDRLPVWSSLELESVMDAGMSG